MEDIEPLMQRYLIAQEEHKIKTMKRQMIDSLDEGVVDIDIAFNNDDKESLFQPILLKFSNSINGLRYIIIIITIVILIIIINHHYHHQ